MTYFSAPDAKHRGILLIKYIVAYSNYNDYQYLVTLFHIPAYPDS